MQLKVSERKPNELRIEIEGEGHTFCNLLESVLLEDEEVEYASYDIKHPLVANPILVIRTKGKVKPETALKRAAEKILQRGKELGEEFSKALSEETEPSATKKPKKQR